VLAIRECQWLARDRASHWYFSNGGVQTVDMPDQEIMSLIIREWGLNPVTSSTVNVHSTLPFKHHELYELMKGIDWD
jgi:hypothetical protein